MKKVNGLVFVVFGLFMVGVLGCSNNDSGNSPNQIPDHLNFVPQKGPAVTDDDFKNFQGFAKSLSVGSPSDFLIKKDDYSAQQKADQKKAKLPSNYIQVLKDMTSKCVIKDPLETTNSPFDPTKDQNHGQKAKTSSISGDQCGEAFSDTSTTDTLLLDFNHNFERPVATTKMTVIDARSESITDQDLQKMANLISSSVNSSGEILMHVDNDKSSLYGKMKFDGKLNMADGTPTIVVHGTGEFLVHDKNQESVIYVQASGYTKPILISISSKSIGDGKARVTIFVNGDQISSDNLKALVEAGGQPLEDGSSIESDGTLVTKSSGLNYGVQ